MTEALDRVRGLCLALPEVTEKVSHGMPTWFVKKTFVRFLDDTQDEPISIWCVAAPGVQEEAVEKEPDRFFRPPYVGVHGWLGVRLDVDVDWDEVAAIIEEAYRRVAPKRLAAELDGR